MRLKTTSALFLLFTLLVGHTSAEYLEPLFAVEEGRDRIGFIDRRGEVVIKPKKHRRINDEYFTAHVHPVMDTESRSIGFIDRKGRWAIPPMYTDAGKVNGAALFWVANHSGRKGLVDSYGDVIAPAQFDELGPFSREGVAAFRIGDRQGWVDVSGNIVEDSRIQGWELDTPIGGGLQKTHPGLSGAYPGERRGQESEVLAIGREGALTRRTLKEELKKLRK